MKELEAGSEEGGEFENYTKKEQLMLRREREKLSKYLNGIRNMTRLPGLMFVVDSKKERIARQRGEQARHPDHRHRRHERRSGSHHGADRRQRRRDPLGRADHEGDRRRDRRGAPRSAGRARRSRKARELHLQLRPRRRAGRRRGRRASPSPSASPPRQAGSDRRAPQGAGRRRSAEVRRARRPSRREAHGGTAAQQSVPDRISIHTPPAPAGGVSTTRRKLDEQWLHIPQRTCPSCASAPAPA